MKDDLTLLILAAGMGSRFGGLKQIEPIGPHGEFIIDYSIYDAKKAGFNKVVFIIKEENYQIFKETIGSRIENKIKVEYVFQKNELPEPYQFPQNRQKPFGTAHAILAAKEKIKEPFVIINSDDFYGRDAYFVMSHYLKNNPNQNYALIGYKVENTLTKNGAVKRGICKTKNNQLEELIESSIIEINGKIEATPLGQNQSFVITKDTLVSMNMIGFYPDLFPILETNLLQFLKENENLETCEYLIPDVLNKGPKKVTVLTTNAKWKGVTYKEDKEEVVNSILKLIEQQEYPENLWDEK